jgi:hypothetical protein
MPLTGEAKAEYNRIYYQKRKLRINEEKIAKNLKENNQPVVEQAPIPVVVEQPPIPEIPSVPIKKEFKKNTDPETFTIDEAREVIYENRTKDNGNSETTYTSKLNTIMTKFNLSKVDGIFSDVYKNSYEKIVETFSGYANPSQYIVMFPYVYDRSIKLKGIVDKLDTTGKLMKRLKVEYKDSRDTENIDTRVVKKGDETNYIQHYKDLFAIEEEFSKNEYASQKHLISLMYSKGLLDNQGNLLMIPRNYFYDIEIVKNNKDIVEKPDNAGKGYNYYVINKNRLYIQSYKTASGFGAIDIKLNNYTRDVIKKSIKERPRKYLFVTNSNGLYSNSTAFGTLITNVLGINVNIIRRAFINYKIFVEEMPRKQVAKLAKHSIQINESTYTTALSNQATKNRLYDENLINKKVSVKITTGGNKGKTLIGTVTRSLMEDRKKYPYLIKFNDTDNQTDEKYDKIPNTNITLYEEPIQTTPRNKKKRKGKTPHITSKKKTK